MKNLQRATVPLLLSAIASGSALAAMDHPMLDQEAPVFSLPSLAGDHVSSPDLGGKYIVLHFAAGW